MSRNLRVIKIKQFYSRDSYYRVVVEDKTNNRIPNRKIIGTFDTKKEAENYITQLTSQDSVNQYL